MAENQAIDVDEVQESKPAKKAAKAGGKPPVLLIAALAVALAAIGFSAFIFLQFNGLKGRLEEGGTLDVPGEESGEHAGAHGDEHGDGHGDAGNYSVPAEGVLYDMGSYTANTADNKFVKMDMVIELDSFYDREEWEVYEAMMEKYNHGVMLYRNYQLGLDEHGNRREDGGHAQLPLQDPHAAPGPAPSGVQVVTAAGGNSSVEVQPAMHGAPKPPPPPEMPELPEKPRSLMEIRLMENESHIRDMINNEISRTISDDFIRPSGKDLFKDNIRIRINDIIGEQYGQVREVLLPDIVCS